MKIMRKINNILWSINHAIWGFAMSRVKKHIDDNCNTKFNVWCKVCDSCDAIAGKLLSY